MKKTLAFLPLLFVLFTTNCTTFSGEYGDPNTVEIIDDKWNETDARKTAEILIKSSLSKPWLAVYQAQHNNAKPIVMVDEIENRTNEHIDTKALTTYIRNELLNSGKVRFIDNKSREKLLEESRGSLKLALLVSLTDVDIDLANIVLRDCNNNLRDSILRISEQKN